MSVIGVKGIPKGWNLTKVVRHFAYIIKANFEALNFENQHPNKQPRKTCFLSLSPKLDPVKIVERINKSSTQYLFKAFIPKNMPNIPKGTVGKKIPNTLRQILHIPEEASPGVVLVGALWEVFTEINTKYAGLLELSMKTDNKLLELIAKGLANRLRTVVKTLEPGQYETIYELTGHYRKAYPPSTDFEFITHCINEVNKETKENLQVTEASLSKLPENLMDLGNSSFEKVISATEKFAERIAKQVTEHVQSLDTEPRELDTVEEVAHKKVRTELKKVNNYIERIIQQVVTKHMVPRKKPSQVMLCVYGEPCLPEKKVMMDFFKEYNIVKMSKSDRMHNLLLVLVPTSQYIDIMALDGTTIMGAKLLIRPKMYMRRRYKMPEEIVSELSTFDDADKCMQMMEDQDDEMDDEDRMVEWK